MVALREPVTRALDARPTTTAAAPTLERGRRSGGGGRGPMLGQGWGGVFGNHDHRPQPSPNFGPRPSAKLFGDYFIETY